MDRNVVSEVNLSFGGEPTSINMHRYLENGVLSVDDAAEIVIPDNEIAIVFDYPLNNSATFEFVSQNPAGFTRGELVDRICTTYKHIYDEEERTASVRNWNVISECRNCHELTLIQDDTFILQNGHTMVGEECAVCKEIYEIGDEMRLLWCEHVLHKNCVDQWFNGGKNTTCPMCRCENFKHECDYCKSDRANITFIGKVLPFNLRVKAGMLWNRPETDGQYRIYGHDFNDLVLRGLSYNPQKYEVIIDISS